MSHRAGYGPPRPAFGDDGVVGGVLVVCQETTKRVRFAEEREELIRAERLARTVAEAAQHTNGTCLRASTRSSALLVCFARLRPQATRGRDTRMDAGWLHA